MKTKLLITIIISFSTLVISAQVIAGQIDDFENGTTQGWFEGGASPNPPINIATGGPAGINDNFLRDDSSGTASAGGKMVILNASRWIGNYTAQGIVAIGMDVRVTTNNLNLRIAMNGTGGGFGSINAVSVSAGSGWTQIVIPISASDLQAVSGNVATLGFDVAATLANCTEFRLLSNSIADYEGEIIAARLEVDNIEALTTLGLEEHNRPDFSIYPNPSHSRLNLRSTAFGGNTTIEIFDVLGKKVFTKTMKSLSESIDISNWNSGIYTVKVSNDELSLTKKLIKH